MQPGQYPDQGVARVNDPADYYVYYFELTPTLGNDAAIFVRRLSWLSGQLSGIFSEEEFEEFRSNARQHGFELRYTLRTPYACVERVQ